MMAQADTSIGTASHWVIALVGGSIATTLLTLSLAAVGFAMLSGRLPLRRAALTILGCFMFLGASTIAAALLGGTATEPNSARTHGEIFNPIVEIQPPPKATVPENYDPYAGAAVMRARPGE